jgi:glycosyltransferase involved in cell wall biosynthesis
MYSVLMTISPKEKPHNLNASLESIVNQSLVSNDIVIVKDGPFTHELNEVLDKFCIIYSDIVTVASLSSATGVANASNIGLERCKNNLVARMDSDDISLPDRFKVQYNYMKSHKEIDLVGGFINEFSNENDPSYLLRKVPLDFESIRKQLIKRNAVNHVTVMFRKDSIISVGGYIQIDNHVDYFLWVRMSLNNKKMSNLEKVLVNVRAGEFQIHRRGGIKYILSEIKFYRMLSKLNFLSKFQSFINIVIRMPFRLSPSKIRLLMYRLLR